MTSQPKLNQRQSRCCPLPENDGGGSDDHDEHCLEKWCKMVAITSLEAGSGWDLHRSNHLWRETLSSLIPSLRTILNVNLQVKVWFQNRRTKHKREETESEQMAGNGNNPANNSNMKIAMEEEEEEEVDCE